jgi:cation-transporting P-type ATPase E
VAERVGHASLGNQITAGARAFRRVLTPLQRAIYLVIRLVLLIAAYLEFLLLVRSVLSNTDIAGNVQNATVVAGLVPNGLFLSISVAYALGAVRIVQKRRPGPAEQRHRVVEQYRHPVHG